MREPGEALTFLITIAIIAVSVLSVTVLRTDPNLFGELSKMALGAIGSFLGGYGVCYCFHRQRR